MRKNNRFVWILDLKIIFSSHTEFKSSENETIADILTQSDCGILSFIN